jgi:aminopeptidase YwaD
MNTTQRLSALCDQYSDRHVGGPGNRAANDLFAEQVSAAGFTVERISFEAAEWVSGEAWLDLSDRREPLHAGPFSPTFSAGAQLVCIETVTELEALDAPGAIVLLHGEIAAEQLTPRRYPFYNTDAHKRILAALDRAWPAAVIAATDRTPMAAALCPFPLFEDSDLGHPSAFLHARDGERLLAHAGEFVRLHIDSLARNVPAEQVVARKRGAASGGRRIVVSAHIDSRYGTPGALDNAGGVCVLLALADLLGEVVPAVDVELVPFNGEDDFAAPGEMAYLGRADADLDKIALVINIDAVGRRGDYTAVSFYGCPDDIREAALSAAATFPCIAEGPEWPMSDHMIFAMRGIPAIAVTSTGLTDIAATVAHTVNDVPALVDPTLIDDAARFIATLVGTIGEGPR